MSRATFITLLLFTTFIGCHARNGTSLSASIRPGKKLCAPVAKCLAQIDKGKKCNLPVPRRARLDLVASGYRLTKARDGVWFFEDLAYNAIILYKGSRLAVIDFPESANDRGQPLIIDAVREVLDGDKPGRIDMVYSHAHYDHIGGATQFYNWAKRKYPAANFFVWGTFETRRMIKASKTKRAIVPNVIIRSRGRTLTVREGLEVKMMIVGGHTSQDLALHILPYRGMPGIVMLVDIVFPRWAPFFNFAISDNVARFVEVQKEILKLDFKFFIGGHIRIGSRADVRESYRFSKDLLAAGEAGVPLSDDEVAASEFGNIFDPSKPVFGNIWFGVSQFRALQIAKCVRIMIEKWGCRFGGVDIVIESHCFIAVTHAIVEG